LIETGGNAGAASWLMPRAATDAISEIIISIGEGPLDAESIE
jgi:hypothetical protein